MNRMPFGFSGVIPILATPFHDDESVDLESLERLIRFNVEVGVDGITVLGLLGESNRLTDEERARTISTAVKAAGALPVIVGTSHTGTSATIDLGRAAIELGAAAVMITPAAQPVPSDRIVLEYFQRIAQRISVPIVLQDHPAMSQVHLSVELILRLVREVPSIAAIKAESVPSPPKIAAIKAAMASGRKVAVLTGLGALYGIFDLEQGSDGFNTGFAFPEVLGAILNEFRQGNVEAARQIFTRYLPLLVFEQQPGVAIRKEILRRRGLLTSNRVRHPGGTIDAATAEQLAHLLDAMFFNVDITKPLQVRATLGNLEN
jgi:4-hydroxy-tetrahydrodipicolinate synthase